MFFFFFFIIININLSLSYIKIPFEKKYKEKITEDNYIDSLLNSKLICELEIGTPNQNLPLTLKLNQYPTYISSSQIKNPNIIKFDEMKSSSYKKLQNNSEKFDYQDFSYGIKSIDKFYFEKNNKTHQEITFILATKLIINETGVLGLDTNFVRHINLGDTSLLKQLKANNYINTYAFSFDFNNFNLILGGYLSDYDDNYNDEDLIKVTNEIDTTYVKWNLKSEKIFYDNESLFTFNFGFLEPSINAIIGTKMFYNKIFDDFFEEYLNNNICHQKIIESYILEEKNQFLFFYCDKDINVEKFKKLIFIYDRFNFELGFNELFQMFEKKYYFLIGFYYKNNQVMDRKWVFGEPFFKKHSIVIDQNKKIIGIYTKKRGNFTSNNILFVVILVFLIFIAILLMVYLYKFLRKNKGKRINKVIENYDYIPNREI
jgi:hypothetical protein